MYATPPPPTPPGSEHAIDIKHRFLLVWHCWQVEWLNRRVFLGESGPQPLWPGHTADLCQRGTRSFEDAPICLGGPTLARVHRCRRGVKHRRLDRRTRRLGGGGIESKNGSVAPMGGFIHGVVLVYLLQTVPAVVLPSSAAPDSNFISHLPAAHRPCERGRHRRLDADGPAVWRRRMAYTAFVGHHCAGDRAAGPFRRGHLGAYAVRASDRLRPRRLVPASPCPPGTGEYQACRRGRPRNRNPVYHSHVWGPRRPRHLFAYFQRCLQSRSPSRRPPSS